MNKTKIEWCDSTWNPVTGCLYGCEYCYARKIATRFGGGWHPAKSKYPVLDEPAFGFRPSIGECKMEPYPYNFLPTFHHYRLEEPQRKKRPRTIFVCSMADLFGDWVPDKWIEEVFDACENAPQHKYLFLTKNPSRYVTLDIEHKLPHRPNFWFGATMDNKLAPIFHGGSGINTFLSLEPLTQRLGLNDSWIQDVPWLIIGAETGNRKGKVVPQKEWIDEICAAADLTQAAVFMKDSLIPIVGEENMRREFPWEREA